MKKLKISKSSFNKLSSLELEASFSLVTSNCGDQYVRCWDDIVYQAIERISDDTGEDEKDIEDNISNYTNSDILEYIYKGS